MCITYLLGSISSQGIVREFLFMHQVLALSKSKVPNLSLCFVHCLYNAMDSNTAETYSV